jgi:basic membrane protein A
VKARLEELKKGLRDGSFAVWKGPVVDQAGKTVLAAGDRFLHGINSYVKGVTGKLPSAN